MGHSFGFRVAGFLYPACQAVGPKSNRRRLRIRGQCCVRGASTPWGCGGPPMASTVMGTGAAPAAAGRTRPIALTPVLLLACAIAVAALGGCASAPQGEHMVGGHRKVTQEELTQRLMAFGDRYRG